MSQLSMEDWGDVSGVESMAHHSSSSSSTNHSVAPWLCQGSVASSYPSRGIATVNQTSGRGPSCSGRVVPWLRTSPVSTDMSNNNNKNKKKSSLNYNLRAWNPLQLRGRLVSPSTAASWTAGYALQDPHKKMMMAPSPAANPPRQTGSSIHNLEHGSGSVVAPHLRLAPGILQYGGSNCNTADGSCGGSSYKSPINSSIARESLSQDSYGFSAAHGIFQNSVGTQGTAASNALHGGSVVMLQQHQPQSSMVVDERMIQSLIDKTMENRFQAQTKRLDDKQRGFHQRLISAEDEQKAGLVDLRKAIAEGMDALHTKVTESERNIKKSVVDNAAALDNRTADFESLAAEALQRHEKLAQATEVNASHVDRVHSKVTELVQKVENSAVLMKELAKSSASAITLARDDFQKMFLSFLKGSLSLSSVFAEHEPRATANPTLDVAATEDTNQQKRPRLTSLTNTHHTSNESSKRKPATTVATVVKKFSGKAKHKVVGARTPLTSLMTKAITITHHNSNSTSNNIPSLTVPFQHAPSSPDRTIASCVTPSFHRVRATNDGKCDNLDFGTPTKKPTPNANNKTSTAVKATRGRKRSRFGRRVSKTPSSPSLYGFTENEDDATFSFLS